jgi:predicted ABC-type ATPase
MSSPIDTPPQAVIIAGPNGSGKSTAATVLLPEGMTFVNADLIASEIAGKPGTPGDINAGRVLLDQVEKLEAKNDNFAFETTLATKMLCSRVRKWRDRGYKVHLVYFWLPSADMAVLRVQQRVKDGGHHVPEDTVRRRYVASLSNFFRTYSPLVDTWRIYDNSRGAEPRLIARGGSDGVVKIHDADTWNRLAEEFGHE